MKIISWYFWYVLRNHVRMCHTIMKLCYYLFKCPGVSIAFQPLLTGFRHCLDSPCLWRVWNYCGHRLCAFFSAFVSYHYCVSIHLIPHAHGAVPLPWTTSGYLIEWSSTLSCVFPWPSALLAGQRKMVVSPVCILPFGLARTSMLEHRGRSVPSRPHPLSPWWIPGHHIYPLFWSCSRWPTYPFAQILLSSWQSCNFRVVELAVKIFFRFFQASFWIFESLI